MNHNADPSDPSDYRTHSPHIRPAPNASARRALFAIPPTIRRIAALAVAGEPLTTRETLALAAYRKGVRA